MQQFEFLNASIPGVKRIRPFVFNDRRGFFLKDYLRDPFEKENISGSIVETDYETSNIGVLRGIHFQYKKPQRKLVRCILGKTYQVVVDLRRSSSTFRKWTGIYLTEENALQIYIPAGCAHAYLALEKSIVTCKCFEKFYPEHDVGIRWDDPDIGIDWPLEAIGGKEGLVLSEKDRALPSFQNFCANMVDA